MKRISLGVSRNFNRFDAGRAGSGSLRSLTHGAAAFLAFCALVAISTAAWAAAPFDLESAEWDGASGLAEIARSELGASRITTTTKIDLQELKPNDGVLLIHPTRSLDVEGLARFLKAGGRLVVLDDFGTGDALLQHFNMSRIPLPARPALELRGNPALAIAERASAHPVVDGVERVVTNHATGIKHPGLSPVLAVRAEDGPDVAVAVAGTVEKGKLLVVGDPSIVMNGMLRYPGNKQLARGLVRYVGDEHGRVYLASGAFEETGGFGESSASSVWGEKLRAMRDALRAVRDSGFSSSSAYLFAVAVGLALVVWTASRAGRTHKASKPRYVRDVPLVAQGGVAGHAAVIGAPKTSRVLAMLELKSALEEDLCNALGLDENPGHEGLTIALTKRGALSDKDLTNLRQLLLRMASIETMVLSQRTAALEPVKDREVLSAARAVTRILATARASLASSSARGHA